MDNFIKKLKTILKIIIENKYLKVRKYLSKSKIKKLIRDFQNDSIY
jgi:hypothetical protein